MTDPERLDALRQHLVGHSYGSAFHAVTTPDGYASLRDYLLRTRVVEFHRLPLSDSEPFVLDLHFYGESFEAAVDTLPVR
jgi:hypothetical protein